MTTAGAVAAEFRRIADALDRKPEQKIVKARVYFNADKKDEFTILARLLPKPLKKGVRWPDETYSKFEMTHDAEAARLILDIDRDKTCHILEPARAAVYDCEPIFSETEEDELETA